MKTPAEALAEIIHVPYVHSIDGSRELEAEAIMVVESIQRDAYRQARLDMAEVLRNCPSQMSEYEYRQLILSAPDKP